MYAGAERSTKAAAARDLSGWCIGVLVLGGGGGVLSGWAQVDNISVKLMALRSTKAVGTAAALVIARPLSSVLPLQPRQVRAHDTEFAMCLDLMHGLAHVAAVAFLPHHTRCHPPPAHRDRHGGPLLSREHQLLHEDADWVSATPLPPEPHATVPETLHRRAAPGPLGGRDFLPSVLRTAYALR